MVREWPVRPFQHLLRVPLRNGLTRPKAIRGEGVKMVNMGELFAHSRLSRVTMDRVPFAASEAPYLLVPGDLLFARQSLVLSGAGKCSIFLGDDEPVTYEGHIIRARLEETKADARFYYYFFSSPTGRQAIEAIVEQVAAAGIRGSDLARLPVPVPPVPEQRAIAHILGTLDDKIELNRRMNETLEALARALFKSWFVDFDPVRAKAEGRNTGLPADVADLFPDGFEDSELGEIPRGWVVQPLDEMGKFLNGLALQKYPPRGERSLPVIKIAQLRTGDTASADQADISVPTDYHVLDGDILFSWSGSLECVFWTGGKGALNQHLFKVTSTEYPKWLLYLAIHYHLPEFRAIASGKATTMGHIQRHHLSEAKLACPPLEVTEFLTLYIGPLFDRIVTLRLENRVLTEIRDALLPKLMSGEIRVKDAEHLVSGSR